MLDKWAPKIEEKCQLVCNAFCFLMGSFRVFPLMGLPFCVRFKMVTPRIVRGDKTGQKCMFFLVVSIVSGKPVKQPFCQFYVRSSTDLEPIGRRVLGQCSCFVKVQSTGPWIITVTRRRIPRTKSLTSPITAGALTRRATTGRESSCSDRLPSRTSDHDMCSPKAADMWRRMFPLPSPRAVRHGSTPRRSFLHCIHDCRWMNKHIKDSCVSRRQMTVQQ